MKYSDPATAQFWWFVGLALVALVPIARGKPRTWVFAGINLAFLAFMLRAQMIWCALFLLLAWLLLQIVAGPLRRALFPIGCLGLLALFVTHKLPALVAGTALGRINPVLSVMGFSYVMLRLLDAARVIRDSQKPAPDLLSTINFLVPFHMLAAGPIQSYAEFLTQPAVPAAAVNPRGLGRGRADRERSVQEVRSGPRSPGHVHDGISCAVAHTRFSRRRFLSSGSTWTSAPTATLHSASAG